MNIQIKNFIGIIGIWVGFLIFSFGNVFTDTLQAIFYGGGILVSITSTLYIGYIVSQIKEDTTTTQ